MKLLRADSGFWSTKVFRRLEQAGWEYSIGVRMIKQIKEIVDQIPETAWQTIIDYPKDGEAQIAETTYDAQATDRAGAPACSAAKPSCGPTGATSRSSPTAPTAGARGVRTPRPRRR